MDTQNDNSRPGDPPRTPPHPPYSPITPVLSHAVMLPPPSPVQQTIPPLTTSVASTCALVSDPGNITTHNTSTALPASTPASAFMTEPFPVPVSESDNPDVIALRSAISILQIQKQQALRDIKTLDHLKHAAAAHPEAFARELANGNLNSTAGNIFNPTSLEDGDGDGDEDPVGPVPVEQRTTVRENTAPVLSEAAKDRDQPAPPSFGKIPTPQQVVRMPPINWAKYHIVGEPLDKLHEEQRRRPSPGELRRDEAPSPQRAQEHFIAAPYRPFTDSLEPPMKARSTNRAKK
ncbi:hypothetical protein AJ78_08451 [Emergomyces pasteurianus Ep9510]|uniref:Uncharacterized protein n=1 Tax=Emergomyces pasteurianus Ep9510 TaxID=1447872 RepID=A0A1J9Q613_9EURO|nr:hypothetical protein AJ78_08451 [Emergomyces pasteurianus Ep9510]